MEEKEQIRKAIELLTNYTTNHDCNECILWNNCCEFFGICPSGWIEGDERVKKFLTNEF